MLKDNVYGASCIIIAVSYIRDDALFLLDLSLLNLGLQEIRSVGNMGVLKWKVI